MTPSPKFIIYPSQKFGSLDLKEVEQLQNLCPEDMAAFNTLQRCYKTEWEPATPEESDMVLMLTELRWEIERQRTLYTPLEQALEQHGYTSYKMREALNEGIEYHAELQRRYELCFSELMRIQGIRCASLTPYCEGK